jgi:hypothetical protein
MQEKGKALFDYEAELHRLTGELWLMSGSAESDGEKHLRRREFSFSPLLHARECDLIVRVTFDHKHAFLCFAPERIGRCYIGANHDVGIAGETDGRLRSRSLASTGP